MNDFTFYVTVHENLKRVIFRKKETLSFKEVFHKYQRTLGRCMKSSGNAWRFHKQKDDKLVASIMQVEVLIDDTYYPFIMEKDYVG